MENREYLNALFDIYKELLTDIEKETFINYYVEDLSFSEIAENRNISKSSVGKTLKNAEDKLTKYESVLHCYSTNETLKKALLEENTNIIKVLINKILEK